MTNDHNTKCTGRFVPVPFGSVYHTECQGCLRKAVRTNSSHHGFYLSPVTLFKDDKCQAKRHE